MIAPDLNVTYSVLRLLVSSREAPLYGFKINTCKLFVYLEEARMIFLLFGTSIASLWLTLSWVIALYWYYKITVLMLVWYCLVSIQYNYYLDLFCSGPAKRLSNCHCHVWVRYTDTTKITVGCMSSLLLSIDILQYWYFIMFYFKLTNGTIVKWCIVKWCNGEMKIRIGHLVSHKYWIRSFVLFLNTTFLQQTKQSIIFNIW